MKHDQNCQNPLEVVFQTFQSEQYMYFPTSQYSQYFPGKTPDSDNLLYIMSDGKVLSSDELPSLPEVLTPCTPSPILKPTEPSKKRQED